MASPNAEATQATGKLTVFGATLLELMARRGMRGWGVLSKELEAKGHHFTPQRISNWAYGRHAVSNEFSEALLDVLDLNQDETVQLAMAFTYGQRKYAGMPDQ